MRFLPFALFSGAMLTAVAANAQVITGDATAVAGDTLLIGGQRIDLAGIDSPEPDQTCTKDGAAWPCGAKATAALQSLVSGQRVDCNVRGTRADGTMLGSCSTEFLNLNAAIMELGWAVATKDTDPALADAQQTAQAGARGVWTSQFVPPADYRASQPKPSGQAQARAVASTRRAPPERTFAGCTIKGNINRRGEWIYHLPGMPYYDVTRAEAFFCSESQAQAAGFRRAIVRR